ncbi:hypothetical protein CLM85_32255 [Streptomyces albidoflavus]|nr:hypothetical protein CLM85_32255 [Streptomyces albidoflavus]
MWSGRLAPDPRALRAHAGVAVQGGLDLAQLDPEAPDLDLLVGAARVLHRAVGPQPHQVAGAVHAGAGRPVRVGDEPPGGQRGPVEVAAGEAGPGDVQLAGDALRDGPQAVVEDAGREVRDGAADDAATAGVPGGFGVQRDLGDVHGGLGDAVHVDQHRAVGVPFVPGGEAAEVEGLAAEDDVAQRRQVEALLAGGGGRLVGLDELVERGRGLVEHGDPLALQQPQEVLRGAGGGVVHDDQAAAVQQRAPQLPHGEVEGVGVEEGPHVVGAEGEVPCRLGEEPHHVPVRHDDALGQAGRAGGVDDVGGVAGAERRPALRVGQGAGRQPSCGVKGGGRVQLQDGQLAGGQGGSHLGAGQQGVRGGIGEDVAEPVGGVRGVERHVAAAGLDHREERRHQVGAARQGHRHAGLGTHAALHQQSRQPAGPLVQCAVGDGGGAVGQCVGVGGAGRLPGEERRQGVGRRGGGGAVGGGGLAEGQHVPLALGVQQRQPGHPGAGVGGHRAED